MVFSSLSHSTGVEYFPPVSPASVGALDRSISAADAFQMLHLSQFRRILDEHPGA